MESRWFNILVVLVWLSTTSWLIVAKVIPPFRRGEPPNYWSMYSHDEKDPKAVAWDMSVNGNSIGWAVSWLSDNVAQITEVHSQIHFQHIPLAELSPAWMKVLLRQTVEPIDSLQMDAFSKLIIDTLGHLTSFQSVLRVPGMQDSISISGHVQGSLLKIEVQSTEIPPIYLPPDALVADELSPQSRLENLHLGQEWTVPVFSPLRPPLNPVDILQARVESRDVLMWEGETVSVFVVVYRSDSGSAMRDPRSKLWVRDDGTVLKQEVSVLGSRLVFLRLSGERAKELSDNSRENDESAWRHQPRRGGGPRGNRGDRFGGPPRLPQNFTPIPTESSPPAVVPAIP
jgi:hypothetical protein